MTSKTISTSIHSYKFAASDTGLTITATGKVVGDSSSGVQAIYAGATRAGESILNLGTVSDAANLYGVVLKDGGTITNGSASVTTASMSGPQIGIAMSGKAGTITNFGSISSSEKRLVARHHRQSFRDVRRLYLQRRRQGHELRRDQGRGQSVRRRRHHQ